MPKLDTRKFEQLEQLFCEVASTVRQALAETDEISSFQFTMKADGRTVDGDMHVEYALSPNSYGGDSVKTNNIVSGLLELIRRHGYDKTHAPLCLPVYHHVKEPEPKAETDESDAA